VKAWEKTDNNVAGTSDMTLIKEQLELLKQLIPSAKKVGILFNTSESNSEIQVKKVEELAPDFSLEVVKVVVTNVNEIPQSIQELLNNVDVLYVPTDNLIVSSMPIVSKIATDNKVAVISSEEGSVKSGALACQGIDYEKLGYKTGELAVKVLNGEKVSDIPVTMLDETQIIVNEDTLKSLSMKKTDNKDILYIKTDKN